MNEKIEKKIGIVLYIISIGMLMLMFYLANNVSVWKDEVATLDIIRNSYADFLLSNMEAAPPVHFIILKFFVDLFTVLLPNVHYLVIAKIVSIFPFVILVVLSATKIRRQFGFLSSALYAFLMTTMPKMLGISIEIRQYSWALLFTTICFIYFWDMLGADKMKAGVICLISGVLATGTHYFACFAVAFIYIFFLIEAIRNGNGKLVISIISVIIGSCVLFLPWLFIAGEQVVGMAADFWIPEITLANVPGFLSYIFITDTNKFNIGYVVVALFYILIVYLLINLFKSATNSDEKEYIAVGVWVPFFVLIVGIIIGKFIWPVFQARYIFPAVGCLWLGFAVALSKKKDNYKVFGVVLGFLGVVCLLNVYKTTKDELQFSRNMDEMAEVFKELDEGDIILTNDYRYQVCFPIYVGNEVVLWNEEDAGDEMIRQWQSSSVDVFYFDTNHGEKMEIDFLQYCEDEDISLENCGEYGLEYVFAELYRVEME